MRISDWSSDVCSSDLSGWSGWPRETSGRDLRQLLVSRTAVDARFAAGAAAAVVFVFAVVAFVPDRFSGLLEREDVGGDAIEETAVMRDDHVVARKIDDRFFERPPRFAVQDIGRSFEH